MIITKISKLDGCLKNTESTLFQGESTKRTSPDELFTVQDISDSNVGTKKILTFNDPKYKDLKILITPETHCYYKDGKIIPLHSSLSFRGQVWGSISNNEKGQYMARAYDEFFDKGMNKAVRGNLSASAIKNDYNFYVPSDGDGTRYKDITTLQGGMTKPASFIPAKLNGEPMRLIHGVLVNFAKTGLLQETPQFVEVEPAKGSAFALLEGLKTGKIPTNKPLVFSWGDNFTDLDVTNLILEHEKERGSKGNSGLTFIAVPVFAEKVGGLSAVKFNNFKDKSITDFVEKPQGDVESYCLNELNGNIPSAVGPYILSPQVLEWLKKEYTSDPEQFNDKSRPEDSYKGKGYDFSSKIIAPLVSKFAQGEFKGENGYPLKMRAKILGENETWSDLGKQKDFSFEMYRIKAGTAYYNMLPKIKESIKKNIDTGGNITLNDKARELFEQAQKEYGLKFKKAIVYAG